ncbi:MAG: NUDIX domain-containing protein [Pseudomonadota bacterium]
MKPIFFFGTLRDLALLEVVVGRALKAGDVQPARAPGRRVWQVAAEAYPMLIDAEEDGAFADGILFFPAARDEVEALRYYEEAEYDLLPIDVIAEGERREALYFGATERLAAGDGPWSLEDWRQDGRAVALQAAGELMSLRQSVPVERINDYWPAIMNRARQRARAAAQTPALGGIRTDFASEDVVWDDHARPYRGYLAVEEHRLRHRLFDGSWSPTLERVTVAWGDAVTVLPYDPVADRVLLIEQFRPAVAARRDPNAWCIEVPAGRIDTDEDAETALRRETEEEAGITLGRLEKLPGYYPTPGLASEHLGAWIGEAELPDTATGIHGANGEGEDIRPMVLGVEQALEALRAGAVNTGPAQILLLWLALERPRLRAAWARGGP